MSPLTNKQVGERIRFIRENKGITQEEVARYLGMTKSNYAKYERGEQTMKDCLFLILRTGARSSEAINLTWADYKMKRLHLRGTKTARSDRYIPLSDDTIEMLERRAEKLHREDDYIFATRYRSAISCRNLLRKMNAINGHTVKDLRHTYATRAAEGGINPKVLQLLLGHSRIETTLSYYTHISEDAKRDAVNQIASGRTRVGHDTAKITQIAK